MCCSWVDPVSYKDCMSLHHSLPQLSLLYYYQGCRRRATDTNSRHIRDGSGFSTISRQIGSSLLTRLFGRRALGKLLWCVMCEPVVGIWSTWRVLCGRPWWRFANDFWGYHFFLPLWHCGRDGGGFVPTQISLRVLLKSSSFLQLSKGQLGQSAHLYNVRSMFCSLCIFYIILTLF